MKKLFLSLNYCWWICYSVSAQNWQTPFEAGEELVSATYEETISFYTQLDQAYKEVYVEEVGKTDAGLPIHVVLISKDQQFNPDSNRIKGKRIVLINNGIHAGEPCGIDASMMLARDLMKKPEMNALLEHALVAIIPIYNIGGMLNRGCCSRANQNGPLEYGFRGNARNFDLNRDFVKTDTRNMRTFAQIFQALLPDIFIDTHTTNGADYAATLTYIPTHPSKAGKGTAAYMQEHLIPSIEEYVNQNGYKICPYVNNFRQSPDHGINGFLDLPRYSSGYASLFQSMSIITEAHMLKPFKDRVWATYHFLHGLLRHVETHHKEIGEAVRQDREAILSQQSFELKWSLDRAQADSLLFAGYEAKMKPSEVTGMPRLYYDRSEPYEKKIPFFNTYTATASITKPEAYLIPQAQYEIVELLEANQVEVLRLANDTVLEVEVQYIESHHSSDQAYEGHYYHDQVEIRLDTQEIAFRRGDYVVRTNQIRNAYLIHVLEPKSQDSFFRWNYFDSYLMRKEYFSAYVFEDKAAEMLAEDVHLRDELEKRKSQDTLFSSMGWMQLNYLYEQSEHYEDSHKRYPVFRWRQSTSLPLMK